MKNNLYNKPQKHFLKLMMFLWFIFFGQIGFGQDLTQTVRGVVMDKENGDPLFGATIFIPELEKGVSSLLGGDFILTEVPVGRYSMKVSFVGYQKILIAEILVESGKEVVLEIGLEKSNAELQEVVVKAILPNQKNRISPSAEILTIEETFRLPATFSDPARLTFAYAGVASVNDQANHMVIRGNSPENMSWRLEGVEIVNPNHLSNAGTSSDRPSRNGGGVNMLSAQVLGNSIFMRGAFPTFYGNALSGIMDMNFRKGNNQKHEFTGQIGVIGTDLSAEGPMLKSNKKVSSYLINYRYSTLGLLGLAGVDLGDEKINYQDVSFHIFSPLKKGGEFRFFGMGGISTNKFESKVDSLVTEDKDFRDIDLDSKMGLIGGVFSKKFKGGFFWKNTLVYSVRKDNYLSLDRRQSFGSFENQKKYQDKTSLKSIVEKNFGKNKLVAGLNATQFFDKLYLSDKKRKSVLVRPFLFLESRYSILDWELGGSISFYESGINFEPKIQLNFTLPKNQTISFAYGKYSQREDPLIRDAPIYKLVGGKVSDKLNAEIEFMKSDQFNLSYKNQISKNTSVRIELYYQFIFDVPISKNSLNSYSSLNLFNDWENKVLENKGTGENYGIEFTAQKYFSKNWYWLTNVSLYESKYKGSDGIERDTRFNGNYIFKLTTGKEFPYKKKNGKQGIIGINANATIAGGMRYSPIDLEASKIERITIFDETQAYSLQQKDYFKSDLRVYWKRNKKKFSSTLALDIQNVTNMKNPSFQYYDTYLEKTIQKYQLGIIPILSYRIEW